MQKGGNIEAKQPSKSSILSDDLNQHYIKHGVLGIEEFIAQGTSTSDASVSNHCQNRNHPQHQQDMIEKTSVYTTNSSCRQKNDNEKNASTGSRFVRINPRFDENETLDFLTSDLLQHHKKNQKQRQCINSQINDKSYINTIKPIKVPWLSHKLAFYAIPSTYSLANSKLFQQGRIYGMDVSSGAAVAALLLNDHDVSQSDFDLDTKTHTSTSTQNLPKRNESIKKRIAKSGPNMNSTSKQSSFRVLDLCCAPGLKTCTIVDLLSNNENYKQFSECNEIRVIGVDISEQRMQLCKNIVQKYHIDKDTCGDSENVNTNSSGIKSENNHHLSKKLKPRISLYCTDGTTFGTTTLNPSSLLFDSDVAIEEERHRGKRKRINKSARARQKKKLRKLAIDEQNDDFHSGESAEFKEQQAIRSTNKNTIDTINKDNAILFDDTTEVSVTIPRFDRVLVDAECSTDGAVRHLQQRHKKNDPNLAHNSKLTNSESLRDLVNLQKRLINSGFRLLKPGGVLVYSTCSLATEQNEDVVSWLLQQYNEEAFIIPVSFDYKHTQAQNTSNQMMIYEGTLRGSVRFHPNVFNTNEKMSPCQNDKNIIDSGLLFGGGFFLAKIGRVAV